MKDKRVLYVRISKTGSTSILEHLSKFPQNRFYHTGHLSYAKQRELNGLNSFTDLIYRPFSFAFVRNTYSRLVSFFIMYSTYSAPGPLFDGTPEGFKTWVKFNYYHDWTRFWLIDSMPNNPLDQMLWIKDKNGKVKVDFIGRFENLTYDFNKVCDKLKIPAPSQLSHLNVSQKQYDYRDYYDSATYEKVTLDFKEEIEYFNFQFKLF